MFVQLDVWRRVTFPVATGQLAELLVQVIPSLTLVPFFFNN